MSEEITPLEEAVSRAGVAAEGRDPDELWCRFGDANHARWKTRLPVARQFIAMFRAMQEHELRTHETAQRALGRLHPADEERARIVGLIQERRRELRRFPVLMRRQLFELDAILDIIEFPHHQKTAAPADDDPIFYGWPR